MGDGGGAQARLIGEGAAAHTPDDGLLQQDAGACAQDRLGGKGAGEDQLEGLPDVPGVGGDDNEGEEDVEKAHEGDELFRDGADALDAAEEDQGHQEGHDDAADQADEELAAGIVRRGDEGGDGVIDGAHDGVGLGAVADAEGGQHGEEAEEAAQPLPVLAHAVFDVVHGAAHPVAVVVALPVLDGEDDLGVLGDHAHEGREPEPEDRAVAAQGDGLGGAHDVAGAHRGGEGGGQGLEGRHRAVAGLLLVEDFAQGVAHGVAEAAELHAAGADGQEEAARHRAGQEDIEPRKGIQRAGKERDDVFQDGHRNSLSFLGLPKNQRERYQRYRSRDHERAPGLAGRQLCPFA